MSPTFTAPSPLMSAAAYLCVSVHVLPSTVEFRFSNVLDVVALATPSMVTVPQVLLPAPLPMIAMPSPSPFVAVTLVTPDAMVILPHLLL